VRVITAVILYWLKCELGELKAEQRFLAVQACKNMVLSVLVQQTPPTPSAPGAECNSAVNQTHEPPRPPEESAFHYLEINGLGCSLTLQKFKAFNTAKQIGHLEKLIPR